VAIELAPGHRHPIESLVVEAVQLVTELHMNVAKK
jgi:predicted ester cyclase